MIKVKLMIGIGVKVLVDHYAPYFGLMLVRLSLMTQAYNDARMSTIWTMNSSPKLSDIHRHALSFLHRNQVQVQIRSDKRRFFAKCLPLKGWEWIPDQVRNDGVMSATTV